MALLVSSVMPTWCLWLSCIGVGGAPPLSPPVSCTWVGLDLEGPVHLSCPMGFVLCHRGSLACQVGSAPNPVAWVVCFCHEYMWGSSQPCLPAQQHAVGTRGPRVGWQLPVCSVSAGVRLRYWGRHSPS